MTRRPDEPTTATGRVLRTFFDIRKAEIGPALALFFLYFATIAVFWCLKPLRTSGVVKAYGPTWYPLFKQGTALLMPLAVWGYSWLAERLRRDRLYQVILAGFMAVTLGFWVLYGLSGANWTNVAFFFYVDVYITLGMMMFYTYLNDSHTADQAKRLYGFIGAGGMAGGVVGTAASGWLSETLGNHLLLLPLPFFLVSILVVRHLTRQLGAPPPPAPQKRQGGGLAVALDGAKLVMRSPYLLAIVGIVGLYELASTNIDYIFTTLSNQAFASRDAMAAYQGKVFFAATLSGFFVQFFLVSLVHRLWGVKAGLLALPAVLALGSALFVVVPALLVISVITAGEGSLHYSINQTSKEMLYTPTDWDTKYKAKAFIDMFVMRGAKGVSAAVLLAFGFFLLDRGYDIRILAAFNVVLIVAWIACVRVAARHFARLTRVDRVPDTVLRP